MSSTGDLLPAVILVGAVVLIIFVMNYKMKCSTDILSEPYVNIGTAYARRRGGEFVEACLWDAGRTVSLSDGTEGVCGLGGVAYPMFSKDHARSKYMGMNIDQVDDIYGRELENIPGEKVSQARYRASGTAGGGALGFIL